MTRVRSLTALALAITAAAQPFEDFWPGGNDDLTRLSLRSAAGRVHAYVPNKATVALRVVALESDVDLPLCSGPDDDVLAITFSAPVVGSLDRTRIELHLCQHFTNHDHETAAVGGRRARSCSTHYPTCISRQVGDEVNERHTVLVAGELVSRDGRRDPHSGNVHDVLGEVAVGHLSVWAGGRRLSDRDADSWTKFSWLTTPSPDGEFFGMGEGPHLADIAFHNLSAPLNTAAADPNGCAALHPSATYAIRLLFDAAVHERAPNGMLVPFASTSAAAAASLFLLRTGPDGGAASPDTLVGLADIDEDNVVDLCVAGAAAEPQVKAVIISCTARDPRLVTPMGDPCDGPIRAFTHTRSGEANWKPNGEGLDGKQVEFCLASDGDCAFAHSSAVHGVRAVLLAAALVLLVFTDVTHTAVWR